MRHRAWVEYRPYGGGAGGVVSAASRRRPRCLPVENLAGHLCVAISCSSRALLRLRALLGEDRPRRCPAPCARAQSERDARHVYIAPAGVDDVEGQLAGG